MSVETPAVNQVRDAHLTLIADGAMRATPREVKAAVKTIESADPDTQIQGYKKFVEDVFDPITS